MQPIITYVEGSLAFSEFQSYVLRLLGTQLTVGSEPIRNFLEYFLAEKWQNIYDVYLRSEGETTVMTFKAPSEAIVTQTFSSLNVIFETFIIGRENGHEGTV